MRGKIKAPFPAFGGKSRVADLVWERLGDPVNFIEPFANSAAVLLARPSASRVETVNDLNHHVANFWRAVKHDPEAVAEHADWPVNEVDLHSRHRWLVGISRPEPAVPPRFARHPLLAAAYLAGFLGTSGTYAKAFAERMRTDPDYFDARIAGWWCWGACCWIGSGWCEDAKATVNQLPVLASHVGQPGKGVHNAFQAAQHELTRKLPDISGHAGGSGRGVHQSHGPILAKRPKLSCGTSQSGALGTGVHANGPREGRPQLADAFSRGRGVNGNDSAETCAARRAWLVDWMGRLSDRFRTVRVCCGDWLRVCDSPSVTTRLGLTAVFFDAPYKITLKDGKANRDGNLYANDRSQDVNKLVDDVISYCVERGADPQMRIAACCLEGEGYEVLGGLGWTCHEWKATGGYANRGKDGKGNENAERERIWFSPHCLLAEKDRMPLFGD